MKKTINNILFDESLNKLFGYNKLFNNFVTLYKNHKLPKILIFTGDKGIGKFTFIFHFINFILSKQVKASYDKENFSIQFDSEIVTLVWKFKKFYPAEDYHQDYYQKNFLKYLAYKKACQREEVLEKIWN